VEPPPPREQLGLGDRLDFGSHLGRGRGLVERELAYALCLGSSCRLVRPPILGAPVFLRVPLSFSWTGRPPLSTGAPDRQQERRSRRNDRGGTLRTAPPSGGARQHVDRLRLALFDLKDEDAGVAAAVRVPVCCKHFPVSPDGIGGGEALGLLVVCGRIADELRHRGPHYALMGLQHQLATCIGGPSRMALGGSVARRLVLSDRHGWARSYANEDPKLG